MKHDFLQYIDRRTGKVCEELVHGKWALNLLYKEGLVSKILLPLISKNSLTSVLYGYLMKSSWSKSLIAPFIRHYGIDISEFEKKNFESFNDFFTRKLKKGARPIDLDPQKVVMPADGRYLVYPKIDRIYAKGESFDLKRFLQDAHLSVKYMHGSMAIIRLCPIDYHRFHFPIDCIPSEARLINGHLFSVNPMALKKRLSIFWENKRVCTRLQTKQMGEIAYVEIGATNVGSIQQTYQPDVEVKKGDEKGYFEFGGSCIVLLFEKDKVRFDADLIENTQRGLETLGSLGQSLAQIGHFSSL